MSAIDIVNRFIEESKRFLKLSMVSRTFHEYNRGVS